MKYFIKNIAFQNGQSIIEIIIVMGILSLFLPALITGLYASRQGKPQEKQRLQAVAYLQEAQEAVRSIRNSDWTSFATNGTFYPQIQSNNSWKLIASINGQILDDNYVRKIVISDAYRDATTSAITSQSSNALLDPSTKEVYISVSWDLPYSSVIDATMYLTRYLNNQTFTETTVASFSAGTTTNTKVETTVGSSLPNDGEIVLSQTGGFGDWCNPAQTPIAQLDLSGQGIPNAVYAAQGNANIIVAAAEGGNASGVTLASISITDPSYPVAPLPTVSGSVSNSPKIKTNGAFTESSYSYLATNQHSNSQQGIIVDITNNSEIGTLDLNSSANGQSIFVLNNIAYLTADNGYLYTFDISTRTGPHNYIGRILLNGGNDNVYGKKIIVVGNNAYVAVSSASNQLQIIDVSTPSSPKNPISISVGNNQPATDLFVNQSQLRAYLVTAYASSSQPDFFTIDINPSDNWYKKVINTFITTNGMNPTGVVAVSGARGIIVGTGSTKNYQVIALANENVPPPALSTCGSGGITTSYNINGIATLFTTAKRAYSYIITDDANHELKIIEGGPGAGNGNYLSTGTFISKPFGPTSSSTAFNSFSATIVQPQPNEVQLLFGIASPVNNSCNVSDGVNYTFVGLNGTSLPFESSTHPGISTMSGSIPFGSFPPNYNNPNKCFAYMVTLSTVDSTLTPVFNDITINYSP